jgi:hypothetical protein
LLPCAAVFAITVWLLIIRAGFAIAQTANSNAGLEGGQDHLVDAIFATPNYKTSSLQDNEFATAPGLEQPTRVPQFTLNVLAPALYNSSAQFLSSGGSQTLEAALWFVSAGQVRC